MLDEIIPSDKRFGQVITLLIWKLRFAETGSPVTMGIGRNNRMSIPFDLTILTEYNKSQIPQNYVRVYRRK
jgi:hypothetical protein